MTIKTILYLISFPIILWGLDAININAIFKKNRYYQARLCYLLLTIIISYLFVNFIIDITNYTKFI